MIEFSRSHPVFTAISAVLFSIASLVIIRPNAATEAYGIADVMIRFLLAVAAGAFLHAISGDKTFDSCDRESFYVIKTLCPFWLVSFILMVVLLIANASNKAPVVDGWLLKVNLTFILCLAIAGFEETLYIAIVGDAIIRQFKRLKWAFVLAGVIHAVIFGAVQFIGADFSSGAAVAAVCLKAAGSVLFSLCMFVLYIRTRNVWALTIVRTICEFLVMLPGTIFENADIAGYAGAQGTLTTAIVIFAIRILFAIFMFFVLSRKVLRKVDLPRLRREW